MTQSTPTNTPVAGRNYIVQPGVSLPKIAREAYGDGSEDSWQKIYKANRTAIDPDPTQLVVGMVLYIPPQKTPRGGDGDGPSPQDIEDILGAHNEYRSEVGVPPLTWSDTLAQSAQQWADYLASIHQLVHSGTDGVGENLWMGTTGMYILPQMIDSWGSEEANFIPGIFPDVSSTGNWEDVGHYTQIVWRNTTEVGCGLASDGQNDYLVAQYSPPGNVLGEEVY